MQGPSRLHVEAEVDVRALAVHHVDLGEPGSLALTQCVDDELFLRDRVRPLLLLRRREGAELALHSTDVRLVQIQVLDEVDAIVTAAPPARETSSAPVWATRTSAPSGGPPASARRTTASSRAARRSGNVGVPSRRSTPAIFPVSMLSPEQSRMSSVIWKAIPSARPNSPSP